MALDLDKSGHFGWQAIPHVNVIRHSVLVVEQFVAEFVLYVYVFFGGRTSFDLEPSPAPAARTPRTN